MFKKNRIYSTLIWSLTYHHCFGRIFFEFLEKTLATQHLILIGSSPHAPTSVALSAPASSPSLLSLLAFLSASIHWSRSLTKLLIHIVLQNVHFSCSHVLSSAVIYFEPPISHAAFHTRKKTTAKLILPGESRRTHVNKILLLRNYIWPPEIPLTYREPPVVLEIWHF